MADISTADVSKKMQQHRLKEVLAEQKLIHKIMSAGGGQFLTDCIVQSAGLSNCARCGQDHKHLDWHSMPQPNLYHDAEGRPIVVGGFAICPVSNAPILLSMRED